MSPAEALLLGFPAALRRSRGLSLKDPEDRDTLARAEVV
jgi:hypothetical protein